MVLQHLVSWVQNAQSVNMHSMNPSKIEQTEPLKSQSDKPLVWKSPWALVFLGILCCASVLSSVVLAILYGRILRVNLNPEVAGTIPLCRNHSAQLLSISDTQADLQRSIRNLTKLNHQLVAQSDKLANNNTQLTTTNYILSLEVALHEEIISNLTKTNHQLTEDHAKLILLNAEFAIERDNMSAAIGVLEGQIEKLTNLHQRELERRQVLSALNTNLSRELRESMQNNTVIWAQSQELLVQNVVLQSESLELRETAERVLAQKKECERAVQNLTETQENTIRSQNQTSSRQIAELRNRIQHLQEEFSSLDLYCPVVNQTTQERHCRSCEDGWSLFRSNCYFFSSDSDSWAHGRTQCQSHGADLLVINSQEEQMFVFAMSWKSNPRGRAWVGMADTHTEGEWRWVDGSLVRDNVQYWLQRANGSSEPDDWRVSDERGEDCGHFDTAETELSCWMDAPCHAHYRWICEKAL